MNHEVIQVNRYLSLTIQHKGVGVKGRKEKNVIRKLNRMNPKFIWKNKIEKTVMKLL